MPGRARAGAAAAALRRRQPGLREGFPAAARRPPALPAELQPIAERLEPDARPAPAAFAREKQAAADISHELRTPLAALLTTIEVALRKPRSAEEYREMLAGLPGQRPADEPDRRAAADPGPARRRRGPAAAAAGGRRRAGRAVRRLVRPLAEAHGLTLSVAARRGRAAADTPTRTSSARCSPTCCTTPSSTTAPTARSTSSSAATTATSRVEVRDTGIGITPEAPSDIFERFYRADPSRHGRRPARRPGAGHRQGYVDLMGGSIAVDSTPGQGTTFTLRTAAGR